MLFEHNLGLKQAQAGDFVELGAGDKHLPVKFFVWGDSHAMAIMPALDVLCKEISIRGVAATYQATPPLVGYVFTNQYSLSETSIAYNNSVLEFIRREHVSSVILVARWDQYIDADKGTERLRSGVLATINALQDSGARIWIMREVPKQRWNVPDVLASAVWHGGDPQEFGLPLAEYRKEYQRQNPIFEGLATKFPGVTVLDPTDLFATNNLCRVEDGGKDPSKIISSRSRCIP